MKTTFKVLSITSLCFLAYYLFSDFVFTELRSFLTPILSSRGIAHNLAYIIVGFPLFIGVFILHGRKEFWTSLGISTGFITALVMALICTSPMLIGYAIVFPFNTDIDLNKILIGAVAAAFFEELYFRGFLFGQLFRFSKFGFIPSISIGAILFALGHMYQSQDPLVLLGVFLTTFLGAILFAWAYVEWKDNLWVPIFLHFFMNLFWMLFSAGDDALGGIWSNVFRVLTIVLIIVGTIVYKRRKGLKLAVNRSNIWMRR